MTGNCRRRRPENRELRADGNRRRSRTYREDRHGGPSQSMKDDYLKARKRAVDANRPDLVEELGQGGGEKRFFRLNRSRLCHLIRNAFSDLLFFCVPARTLLPKRLF